MTVDPKDLTYQGGERCIGEGERVEETSRRRNRSTPRAEWGRKRDLESELEKFRRQDRSEKIIFTFAFSSLFAGLAVWSWYYIQ